MDDQRQLADGDEPEGADPRVELAPAAREVVTGTRRDVALVRSVDGNTPLVDSVDSVGVLTPASVAEHFGDALDGLVSDLSIDRDGDLVAALGVEALYVLLT